MENGHRTRSEAKQQIVKYEDGEQWLGKDLGFIIMDVMRPILPIFIIGYKISADTEDESSQKCAQYDSVKNNAIKLYFLLILLFIRTRHLFC